MLTDERLRRWLDGNQPQRERMCAAILGLDRRYTQVVPRRPRGGPDGGRDLEALFEGRSLIWGAVGFRNGANDSAADKRWVKNKFANDLGAARDRSTVLDHFVFFTNIDLSPREVGILQQIARKANVVFCDIFGRERIRLMLDSPQGLALRYQYLGIEMSSAEQAAFFALFEDGLQRKLDTRFDQIDRKLEHLEFQNECARASQTIALSVRLKQPRRSDQFDKEIRLFAVAVAESKPEPHPCFCLSIAACSVGKAASNFKWEAKIWTGSPLAHVAGAGEIEAFPAQDKFVFGVHVENMLEFERVADFNSLWLKLYANSSAIDSVRTVELVVNGYRLAQSEMEDLIFDPSGVNDEWLMGCFGHHHRRLKFFDVVDSIRSVGEELPIFAYTDFVSRTPLKMTID